DSAQWLQRSLGNDYLQTVADNDLTVGTPTLTGEPRIQQLMQLPIVKASGDSSQTIQRKCAACETEQELCPGCAEEEIHFQRMLIPADMIPALEGGIAAEVPVEVKEGPKKPAGEKKEEKKEEPAKKCPTQTVSMSGAQCGAQYGAVGRYCYSGLAGWWFKERVVNGSPNTCDTSPISQTTTPIQSTNGCVSDLIFD